MMAELKKPSALEIERMLGSSVGQDVSALELATIPRLYRYATGVYADYEHQMVGALVLDIKLCCLLVSAVEKLDDEAAQELLLTQELTDDHLALLRDVLEILSCLFFLVDGSDRLRCSLHELVATADGLSSDVKGFMAAPPCHCCYQIAVPGYGEGTLIYIAVDAVSLDGEHE